MFLSWFYWLFFLLLFCFLLLTSINLNFKKTLHNLEEPDNNDWKCNNHDSPGTETVIANVLVDEQQIEKTYIYLLNCIEEYIKVISLKKEYYPNLPDWTNPEIDEMSKLSPYEIWKRLDEDKWIFYMRSCIPQTLYSIDKIKEKFSELVKFINLYAEIYRDKERNVLWAHFFILINVPNRSPLIIDYAHDNDVYIYSWEYSNKSEHVKAETLGFISMPATDFNDMDNIINIIETANKSNKLDKLGFNPLDILFNNEKLKKDNTLENFREWREKRWSKWVIVHMDF